MWQKRKRFNLNGRYDCFKNELNLPERIERYQGEILEVFLLV